MMARTTDPGPGVRVAANALQGLSSIETIATNDVLGGISRLDSGDDPELTLAGVGTPNAAQVLKEKTMVGSEGLEPPTSSL